jgi:hypothetical protein
VCNEVERTGTFKMKKATLQREGYDLNRCAGNPVFLWDNGLGFYIPLTRELQTAIEGGKYAGV